MLICIWSPLSWCKKLLPPPARARACGSVQYSWKSWGLVINGAAPWPFFDPPWLPPPPPFASGALKLVCRRKSDPNPRRLFDSSVFLEKTSLKLCVCLFWWFVSMIFIIRRRRCLLPERFWQKVLRPSQRDQIRWNQTSVGVGVVLLLLLSIHSVCVLEMRIRRRRDETNVPQQNARSLVRRVTRV